MSVAKAYNSICLLADHALYTIDNVETRSKSLNLLSSSVLDDEHTLCVVNVSVVSLSICTYEDCTCCSVDYEVVVTIKDEVEVSILIGSEADTILINLECTCDCDRSTCI